MTLHPDSMMPLPDEASADEARREAGLTEREWEQFVVRLSFCAFALSDS